MKSWQLTFSCSKHLVKGFMLSFSTRRSQILLLSVKTQKNTTGKTKDEAKFFIRKMTTPYKVVGAIEKTLLKTPTVYRYYDFITKPLLATTGQQNLKHKDVITKEPITRVIVALCVGTAFIGPNSANAFQYQKFGLREITIYRKKLVTAGTPMSTTDNKRLYISLIALAFVEYCHGIPLSEILNQYKMVFDVTSTQEAPHYFIHLELTNSPLSVNLKFDAALAHNVETLFLEVKSIHNPH